MIPVRPLAEVILGRTSREKLHQGWSPQCIPTPALDGQWGVLKTTAIQAGAFHPHENKELPPSLEPRPALEVHSGDLLLTCAGPRARCGVPTLVRKTRRRLMLSGKMYRFRADAELIDPRYLEMYLLSPEAQRRVDLMKTGISDSGLNLTKDRFLALPVPVPTLEEQRRIVDILDDHLSRLSAAGNYLSAAERRCWALGQATIVKAIPHTDRSPGHWRRLALGEVARLGSGGTPSAGRPDYYEGGSIPWAVIGDLNDGLVTETRSSITQKALEESSAKLVPSGAVLIAMYGTIGKLGISATEMATNQAIAFALPHHFMDARFLFHYLASQRGRLSSAGKGAAQKNISQTILRSWPVPVPPLEEQVQIAEGVHEAHAALERLERHSQLARRRTEQLRHAVLRAAFTGGLTHRTFDGHRVEERSDV